jgi:glutathione S-transferase
MRLDYSATSPYVRKVTVTACETGLDARIERVATNAWDPDAAFLALNPLSKVPTLLMDDGHPLYDSPVICEYLDSLHEGRKLFPPAGPERWAALRQQALADGIMDAGVAAVVERTRRPESFRWPAFIDQELAVIGRALDVFEEEALSFEDAITIGQIAAGCALGYLDFRFSHFDWRDGRPALATWFQGFSARPSMASTTPRDKV